MNCWKLANELIEFFQHALLFNHDCSFCFSQKINCAKESIDISYDYVTTICNYACRRGWGPKPRGKTSTHAPSYKNMVKNLNIN